MKRRRIAGVTLPLFSLRGRKDWGIGEIPDLPACARWLRAYGFSLLQVLPTFELADGETSPYGARTAFGLDPIYIGGLDELSLGVDGARAVARLRDLPHVAYRDIRALKARALAAAFERFHAEEHGTGTGRDEEVRAFIARERSWLDDLSLYVALRESHDGRGWRTWPVGERDRHPESLVCARATHARRILEYQFVQWMAHDQWARARAEVRSLGVELMGDLPFVVGQESADVWAHAGQFQLGLSLGAPPDAFSPDGQDWGLPPYDWAAMDATELAWIRARTRHAAALYDCFRIDHVVGYFRQYVRVPGERGAFDPQEEEAQRERGARVLAAIVQAAGTSQVVAEDLGVIPPFVREALSQLGLPGYRVLPWERDDAHRLRDPRDFPAASVATWSTHDTPPITQWWDELQPYERDDFARLMGMPADAPEHARVRRFWQTLFGSGSDLALLQAQELLGERARVNTPGTVNDENWTWRLARDVSALAVAARPEEVAALLREAGRA